MLGYLSGDIICSEKRTVFRERSSWKTVSYEEQITSKDKYPSIFSPQMTTIVFIILQIFFTTRAVLKIGKYINNSRHLARKYARIFVRGHYLFREANSFPRAKLVENCELRGTDNVQGQISEHIFASNGDYCLYYPSNLFRNARSFENWGIFNNYSPKWRWLVADIYRAAKRRGKYPKLATDTEVNSCFSIY